MLKKILVEFFLHILQTQSRLQNELFTPLDLARRREHQVIVEYLSQRHGGMAAADLSSENQSSVRYDIEERLKTGIQLFLYCVGLKVVISLNLKRLHFDVLS